jgi:hypothetical protein
VFLFDLLYIYKIYTQNEKLEETKWLMNPVSQRTDNTTQWTTAKGPKIIIYKTPHRTKVNIEQN